MKEETFRDTGAIARMLGVSKDTIYRLVKTKQLTAHRLGNKLLYSPEDIEKFLASIRLTEGEAVQD